jgi:hypothetical protein
MEHAANLKGALFLLVGEMDNNVDPSSTMQVVNALIKANKTFDLLVMPGEEHGAGRRGTSADYGNRKLFDYFVHNLLGAEPPQWNAAVNANASERGSDLFGPGWESIRRSFEPPVPGDSTITPPPRR